MVSSKKDMFVLINWLCSVVALFTLPHLFSQPNHDFPLAEECSAMSDATGNMSFGNVACVENNSSNNHFGSLLGFASVSYLVGYFGILLSMKEQDRRSKKMHDASK